MNSEIKERIVVGLLIVGLIILANFISELLFLVVFSVIFILASFELIKMFKFKTGGKILFTITSIITIAILSYFLEKGVFSNIKILIPFYVWFLVIILIILFSTKDLEFFAPSYGIYLWIPFVFLIFLRKDYGSLQTLILFLTVWSFDSFAYLFGKKIGKTKIAPLISPNKTWEGTIFGIIISFFVFLSLSIIFSGFSYKWVFLGFAIPIYSLFGDLFESFLKRQRGLKDSGSILGAHGGILDRFDSLFFAVIAYYSFLLI